jgi:hypothetical protein
MNFKLDHVKWCLVAASLSVLRLQEYHEIRIVTANLLNKRSVTADKGLSSSFGDGQQGREN